MSTASLWFLYLMPLVVLPLQAKIQITHHAPPSRVQHYFLLMKGAYEQSKGLYTQAAQTFSALTPHLESPHLRAASWHIAFEQHNLPALIADAKIITTEHANDKELLLKLAQAYLQSEQLDHAADLLLQLQKQVPDDDRIDYFAATTLLKLGRYHEAQLIITAALNQQSRVAKHYLFHFLNAKQAFLKQAYQEALLHVQRCQHTHPQFSRIEVLKGLIYEKMGKNSEALTAYGDYLSHSDDRELQQKYLSLAFDAERYPEALAALEKWPQNTAAYYHDCALVHYKLGNPSVAHTYLAKAFAKEEDHLKSRVLLIHLLLEEKQYTKILALFKEWISKTPTNEILIKTLLRLQYRNLSAQEIATLLEQLATEHKNHGLCFALGDFLHSFKAYPQARHWYMLALNDANLPPRGLRASQLYFQIACTYLQENNLADLQKPLEQALACEVIYPSVYNLQAYIYALSGENLHRALQLSALALAADPKNQAYLDTYEMAKKQKGYS